MQKVYLLLRQNSQTGPFNLEELLQFDLKPYDLIWIEGKSAGWYYPQEIEALQPHLSFLKQTAKSAEAPIAAVAAKPTEATAPKKIFVSMPAAATVIKEETKPQVAAAPLFTTEEKPTPITASTQADAAELKTSYAKSMNEVESDDTAWMHQKKTVKKKPVVSASGIAVLCLISVALFAVWKFANKPQADEPVVASQEQPSASVPSTETPAPDEKPASPKTFAAVSKKSKAAEAAVTTKHTETAQPKAAMKKVANGTATEGIATDEGADKKPHVPEPMPKEEPPSGTGEKTQPTATEAPKEKKKLRDKIFDIFRKKQPEESKPAETENGSRSSTRREAGSSLVQLVAVKFEIPNSWMMGIKGAKATLANRSSETLAKAVVEVVYYNDDNEVLAKKTIQFSNVKSKGSQTVSVPEHETATRLEYNVISAVGDAPGA